MTILYGIPSEGMGHATRATVVIDYLLSLGHDVQIVSSDKVYQLLSSKYPGRVHQIRGFHFAWKQDQISISGTIKKNLKELPQQLQENLAQSLRMLKRFQFDLVISDFESFAWAFATFFKIPLWSIDNMQVIARTQLDIPIPVAEKKNFRLSRQVVRLKVPGAHRYFISSFFFPPIQKSKTVYIPPIIRESLLKTKVKTGNHVLMYQSSMKKNDLLQVLKQCPKQTFIIYGLNIEEEYENCQFRKFSEAGFIHDLTTAKAVMANGGYSFLSEAIYLHKPVYSVPIPNQFEQFVNASYIDQLGYGMKADQFEINHVTRFLKQIPLYRNNLKSYQQDGNQLLYQHLDQYLKK
ncbi:MAG: hypothetical protein JNJ58_00275 [Chitinophagaceae bacterium]|nr:hypothetical protein [Chitinophagaceae bacterium]